MTPTSPRRRLALLAAATATWLACFAVARHGTWIPFAVAGAVLAVGAVVSGTVPMALLRPSRRTVAVGLAAGALMTAVTHAGYAVVAPFAPGVRAATVRLFDLVNAGGFPTAARAGLVVVIAVCEEVLFRGPLPPSPARGIRGLGRGDVVDVAAFAAAYALATVTLGNALLVACAFVCGAVWGAMRLASGSLVVPIAAHVIWDLGVAVLWPLEPGR